MEKRKSRTCVASIIIWLGIIFCAPAYSATWYVDADAPIWGDGHSWSTAFKNIQKAINAASEQWTVCFSPPDQIKVKEGTYYLTSEIVVNKVVSIVGGYNDLGKYDPVKHPTIIDGRDLVRCMNITQPCTIKGFIIRNGNSAASGGGIYVDSNPVYCPMLDFYHAPIIKNCRILNNTAVTGGGIYDNGSDIIIRSCIFRNNSAVTGGAIYHVSSGLTIEECVFSDNESTGAGSLGGGAVGGYRHNYTTQKYASMTNCLFHHNDSASWGGAVSYTQVYPTIINCTFADNNAAIAGGAFHGNMNSEAPNVANSIFWGDSPDELDIVTSSPNLSVRYSDVQGGWTGAGTGNLDDDPEFISILNYRLRPQSPCIDTGSNYMGPDNDLDDGSRPVDGNDDGIATCDMGAYEHSVPGDFDRDFDIDGRDFSRFMRTFGYGQGNKLYYPDADFVGTDDQIDENDLEVMAAKFGKVF
ncbi:MAG: hypothetical protein B1H12_09410 [Desulfobacteraceae bacterium 4484_190.2]|nr:MAG: hypothetical protein B1H12_09410 [Desulfobacteraceae bacterium 4484_190.2]